MNNMTKKVTLICSFVTSASAMTVIFNGCSNTPNDYFTFTAEENEYCIKSCVPKLNPESDTTVTLKIPGCVDGNQVSLKEQAFNWENYTAFPNLKVNLIFEKVGNTYVQMPDSCVYMFKEATNSSKKIK